jgi:hypothetical protein
MIGSHQFRTVKKVDTTEDGDIVYLETYTCPTAADAREVQKELDDQVNVYSGRKAYHNIVWKGRGGKLVYENTFVVDGALVALELRNDARAWADSEEDERHGFFQF